MARVQITQTLTYCDKCDNGVKPGDDSKCADIKAGTKLVEIYKVIPARLEAVPQVDANGKQVFDEGGQPKVQLIDEPMQVKRVEVCTKYAAPYLKALGAFDDIEGEDVTPKAKAAPAPSNGNGGGVAQTAPNYKTRAMKEWCTRFNRPVPKAWQHASKTLLAEFYATPGYAGWETWEKGQPPVPGFDEKGKPVAQMTLPTA